MPCSSCGKLRPDCDRCRGPCKCSRCHGGRGHCEQCGRYHPCWGGDGLVFRMDGATTKVRDCCVGDEVRTLRGYRRIVRIWHNDPERPDLNKEVCCLSGVWITAKHPVICTDRWVNPCDIIPTAPWRKRQHVMSDMFTFELEGHDDTMVLWGGPGHEPLVTCTLGKHLGPCFGQDVWTRRSTSCAGHCAQCSAVHVPGIRFDADMDPAMRERTFPEFPQVEWCGTAASEFDLAAQLIKEHL